MKYDINTSKAEVLWLFSGDAAKTSVSQVLEKSFYTRKSGHWNYKQALGALMSLYNTVLFHGFSKKKKTLKFLACLWHYNTFSNNYQYMAQICGYLFPANGLVNLILNHCTFPHKSLILCISISRETCIQKTAWYS